LYLPPAQARAISLRSDHVTVVPTDIGYRPFWQRFLWDQITLRRIVRQIKAHVLISTSDFGMLFPPCKQVLLVRNPLFFSRLYLAHILPKKSYWFRLEFLLRRWLIARSIAHADVVTTASKSMLDDVRRFIAVPDEKAVVNYFGVPIKKFDVGGRRQAGQHVQLLYISEYSDYKNLTTLLKALLILRQKGEDNFRLVSSADPSQFPEVEISSRGTDRALAGHPLVASYITFTGTIPYEEVERFYAVSDIFVFPSLAESFGHPLVEAMASGLPIVASDIPICREICDEAAVYFNPFDAADLAEKIVLLKNQPGLRRQLGQYGRKRAETEFNWDDHVRRFIEIMDSIP
jgi:glycosyltransferase involved in cell wall biosynthesis